jgi:hypothetical protein
MSRGHFALAAQRTPGFVSPVACRGFHAAAYAFGNRCLAATSARGAAPDLSIGTTKVLVTAQDIVPRAVERKDGAHCSPPGEMMLSAERVGKFPFAMRFDTGMLLHKPGCRMPQGQASRVRGGAPAAPSPPRGARGPLRLRDRPPRRRPVPLVANRSCQRHCPHRAALRSAAVAVLTPAAGHLDS